MGYVYDLTPIPYVPPARGVTLDVWGTEVRIPRSTLARLIAMAREQGRLDPVAVAVDILCEDDSDPRTAIHEAACRWARDRGRGCLALSASGEWAPRPSTPEPWAPREWTPRPPQPEPEEEVMT